MAVKAHVLYQDIASLCALLSTESNLACQLHACLGTMSVCSWSYICFICYTIIPFVSFYQKARTSLVGGMAIAVHVSEGHTSGDHL